MKAIAAGYEKNLDPNCVKYVREHQGRVQKEEWEHAGELLASGGNSGRGWWGSTHRSLLGSLEQNGDTKTSRLDEWKNFPFRKSLKTMTRTGGVGTFAGFRVSKRLRTIIPWID